MRGRKVSVQKLKGYEEESGVSGGGVWGSGLGGGEAGSKQSTPSGCQVDNEFPGSKSGSWEMGAERVLILVSFASIS